MEYKKALEKIASPKYGLQAIYEDYPDENIDFYKELARYYCGLASSYQSIARKALEEGN